MIDANYRDVAKLIAATEVSVQQEADAHYRKGISYYLSEDLERLSRSGRRFCGCGRTTSRQKKLLNARRLKEKINKF